MSGRSGLIKPPQSLNDPSRSLPCLTDRNVSGRMPLTNGRLPQKPPTVRGEDVLYIPQCGNRNGGGERPSAARLCRLNHVRDGSVQRLRRPCDRKRLHLIEV